MATVKSSVNTTTGINIAGVPKIQKAIENYRKSLTKKIDLVATKTEVQKAVKGTASEANLKAMSEAIEQQMKSLLNNLSGYERSFEKMVDSYKTHDTDNQAFTSTAGIKSNTTQA